MIAKTLGEHKADCGITDDALDLYDLVMRVLNFMREPVKVAKKLRPGYKSFSWLDDTGGKPPRGDHPIDNWEILDKEDFYVPMYMGEEFEQKRGYPTK